MKILAILQNQWFKDPEKTEAMYARRPDLRNYYIGKFLFMGCKTGKVLQQAFGEELCDRIIWEEASPKIAGISSGVFPADLDHIKSAIEKHKPDVIVCFGNIAGDGVGQLRISIPVLNAPHPAARNNPIPALMTVAEKLRNLEKEIMKTECRAYDQAEEPSFHVDYSTDDEGLQTENLTHRKEIEDGEIEERGDSECGWVAQFDGELVWLLVSTDSENGGWDIAHKITAETAEQLSDMFARAAKIARERIQENQQKREQEEKELAAIKASQGDLFTG